MELFTAINQRQSCRDFLNEPVQKDVIEKIIEAGTMAPSPLNSQPWDFIVVTNNTVKDQIWEGAEKCKAQTPSMKTGLWHTSMPGQTGKGHPENHNETHCKKGCVYRIRELSSAGYLTVITHSPTLQPGPGQSAPNHF
jgi:nitroreductase